MSHFTIGTDFVIQWMFSLVVVIASFMIYFKTKELYELSGHKGIKYFREAFFFFGITYLANIVLRLINPGFLGFPDVDFYMPIIPTILMAIAVFTSTTTFLYLILTVFWKKVDKSFVSSPYFIGGISLFVVLLSFFDRMPFTFFFFQLLFFLVFIVILIFNKSLFHKKQNPLIVIIYLLIFGHWILLIFLNIFSFLFPVIGSLIYIVTLCFFVVLLDRFWLHFSISNKQMRELNEETRKTRSNKRHTSNNKRKK